MRKLFSLSVAVAALIVSGSTVQAQWGTLKGRVHLDGEMKKLPLLVTKDDKTTKDAAVCAAQDIPSEKLVVSKDGGIANVFIYLAKKPAKVNPGVAKSAEAEIKFDQKGCRFLPHAMVVRTDQQVTVLSDDAVAHNTHSYPIKNTPENFVVPPNNRTGVKMKPLTLAEKLPIRVSCDIHPWMEAYWLVIDHPYGAVTDEDGNFEIKDLPAGDHEFIVWHEGCGYLEKKLAIKIKDGATEEKTLKFKESQILKK